MTLVNTCIFVATDMNAFKKAGSKNYILYKWKIYTNPCMHDNELIEVEMTVENIPVYPIIVLLVVAYSQLVVSHSLKKLGTSSSHPATSCRGIYDCNKGSRGQSGYY